MNAPKAPYISTVHYHIRRSSSPLLDWQAFETPEEAEAVAKNLVRGGETYTIELAAVDCKRCLQAFEEALRRQAAHNDAKKKARIF